MQHITKKQLVSLLSKLWKRTKQVFRIVKKTIILASLLVLLAVVVGTGWLYREFSYVPKVKPDTVLVMNMDGMIIDGPSNNPDVQRLLGEDIQTRHGIVNNIRKASHDPRIIGILLKFDGYCMTSTTALEIRDELLTFRQAGKKIFAYMEWAGKQTYFLASPAHKIYMPPPGDTYLRGWRAEIPFYKDMFDKIGIAPEFIYIGKYKTAPQIFTMNHLSDEYREVLNDVLDAYYDDYVEQIAHVRNVPVENVKTWIDDGLYSAVEAIEVGMIDELRYEHEVEKRIQVELGLIEDLKETEETEQEKESEETPELNTINMSQYARVKVDAPGMHNTGEKIAVLYAQGSIVSGESPPSPHSGMIASETMTALLKTLTEDKEIKGIILRIDSGGGGARASSIIWDAIRQAQKKKPVVVSMAGAAASGGYMISAPADSIVAYPLTITGSIGIFGGKFSMGGLFDLIGLNVEIVQRGKNAGMFTGARTWTEGEKKRVRHLIQEGYDDFLAKVAQGRDMTVDAVDKIAQGRVWTGQQALNLGLVDTLGGMETAIAVIKEKIGIPEEKDVHLVEYPKVENPVQLFLKRLRETQIEANLPDELHQIQQQFEEFSRLEDEHLFAWFPAHIVVE